MKVFKKQEEALLERKEDQFIYAVNYKNSKACFFVNATEAEFWEGYMSKGPRNNYEKILPDRPCHLFLDLDLKVSDYPNTDIYEVWETIKQMIVKAFEYFGINDFYFIVLQSHSDTKQSLHIIAKVKDKLFHNLLHCGHFMDEIKESVDGSIRDIIDTTVYTKNRNFRMVGCTKAGQERYLTGDKPLSFEFWKETKIQPLEWKGDTIQLEIKPTKQYVHSSYMPPRVIELMQRLNTNRAFLNLSGPLEISRAHSFSASLVFICDTTSKHCPFVKRRHRTNITYVVIDLLRKVYYLKCRSKKCCEGKRTPPCRIDDMLSDIRSV